MFFSRCAANMSHALAIASSERLASGSLKLWTSRRHLSAFRRYRSTNSDTVACPLRLKRRISAPTALEKIRSVPHHLVAASCGKGMEAMRQTALC
jgi:hypothetical protein